MKIGKRYNGDNANNNNKNNEIKKQTNKQPNRNIIQ